MDIVGLEFVRGVEMADGTFVLAAQDPELSLRTNPHTGLVTWREQDGWQELGMEEQVTVDMATCNNGQAVVIMDPFGNVLEYDGDSIEEKNVNGDPASPPKFEMRCIRAVGNTTHAGGVARQAFRRPETGAWQKTANDDMLVFDDPTAFSGIDGFSETEVYAAGWKGEIWSFDGEQWHQQQSPTNVILNDICAGDDECVAVGLMGQIVVGRGTAWRSIENTLTQEPFWSVRSFNGAFYLSTIDGIFQLKQDELTFVKGHSADMRTTYGLSVGPSGLWSVGSADIALFDGNDWTTIGQS